MATCKDCLHDEVCQSHCDDQHNEGCYSCMFVACAYSDNAEECPYFKDKNHFVELPCKIGQTVYEVVFFRNGAVSHISPLKVVGIHIGNFPDRCGHKRKSYLVVVYPTSEILGRISLDKIEKTLFLTKEDAEAALAKMGK